MNTDAELLRRYVEEKSEPAFTELVQRYVGLVYSVALRRVGGDTHFAEDVAQRVFTDLARKARALHVRDTLGGWLYLSAHAASAAIVRSERRRKARELTAHLMNTSMIEPPADWSRLRPVIDDAIVELKKEDRDAVVLRFFERRSFSEVGAALRLTEDAARKRVDRALEKLRAGLARRGIASTVSALGVALTAVAATSVPAGLGAKVAGSACATAGANTGSAVLTGWLGLALPAASLLIFGGLVLEQRRTNNRLEAELAAFSGDRVAMVSLASTNRELSRTLTRVEALRSAAAGAMPQLPQRSVTTATPASRPIAATVSISPQGTISWDNDHVSLREFIERMRQLKSAADPASRLHVRTNEASYSAVAYVIDEARKAGIEHLTVEGGGKPADQSPSWWF